MLVTELMQQTRDPNVMRSWIPILEDCFGTLDKEFYARLYDDIWKSIYGEKLSMEKAEALVAKMKPYGQKWTKEETEGALRTSHLPATRYYVMNMLYNDYRPMLGDDVDKYVQMARLWLEDQDSPGGDVKTYRYATAM